ncbi:MAG: cadherin-like beta sandwich domain-containing protein [Luteolibacter sp.]
MKLQDHASEFDSSTKIISIHSRVYFPILALRKLGMMLGMLLTLGSISSALTVTPAISAGAYHSVFIKSDGSTWTTGNNSSGQLGNGNTTSQSTPMQVMTGMTGAITASAGGAHSLFLKSDGSVWATGFNGSGRLGNGTTQSQSTPVQVMTGVNSISAGGSHSLFLKIDGSVWATGYNASGQLGNGDTNARSTPVQVMTGVIAISAGSQHSLFLKSNGSVWAAGHNNYGQLGNGMTSGEIPNSTPVQVMTGVIAISAGQHHSLFLKNDGSAWAVGYNNASQLGNGNAINQSLPVQVMTGVTAISAGQYHSLFLKSNGSVWAAGSSGSGQFGNGNTTTASTPVQVMTGVAAISAGLLHSLFLKSDGSVLASGSNDYGQLANGNTITQNTAVLIFSSQNISFSPITDKAFGSSPFALNASASSNLPVTFAVISGPATISGNIITLTGLGAVTVRASQLGNGNYTMAPTVDQSFIVKTAQNIIFPVLSSKTYDDTPFPLIATASSNLPVSFSIVSGPATISGTTVSLSGGGTVTVRASQTGNATYLAASNVDQSFTVKAAQSIIFSTLPTKGYGDAAFALSATASSNLPVSFSIVSGPATISGNVITLIGLGTVTVRAAQSGSANYVAAPTVDQSFTVKTAQSIMFPTLINKIYGDAPFTLSATASSSLPVSFSIVSGPAIVSGSTITLTGAGTVTVRALQAGDLNYASAVDSDQSFIVKATQTIIFSTLSEKTYGSAPFSLSATASSGLGITFTIISGPATISGNTVTINGEGTVIVRASQAGNPNYVAATSVDQSFLVKAAQTIIFPALPGKAYGDAPFTLSATASSTLPVSFNIVSGPATVSGNIVTLTGLGSVTVRASQAGNAIYVAAATVDQIFTVKSIQSINFTVIGEQFLTKAVSPRNISAGPGYSQFLKSDGSVWAVGYNYYGQLGNGSTIDQYTPVKVITGVTAISTSDYHSLFLKSDGSVWATGNNTNGQLGNGNNDSQSSPIQIMTGVVQISAGTNHSLFLKANGSVWAAGYNGYGQLGNGNGIQQSTPIQVMTGVVAISAGDSHSLFLKSDGSVWAVGNNNYGQLGNGNTNGNLTPVWVMNEVSSISAGGDHSLFLKNDGSAWAVGSNFSGQLGYGITSSLSTPIQVMTGVAAISAGGYHSLFMKNDGSVWATGENASGQLGNGNTTSQYTPIQLMTGASAIAAGNGHSLFLKNDGSSWAAGANNFGQLGNGNKINRSTPVPSLNMESAAQSINLVASTTSGLGITYTVISGPATVSGSILVLTGAGTVTVRATQVGDLTYAATYSDQTFTISRNPQTINFTNQASRMFNNEAAFLTATATSGLPVAFNLVSGPATLRGSSLMLTGVGNVVIRASQAGDANYTAAPDVTRTITVTPNTGPPTAITLSKSYFYDNVANPSELATLTATDPDAGDSLTYSLVSGSGSNDNAKFTIAGDRLRSAAYFNYNSQRYLSIRVRVTDSAGQSYEQVFQVQLLPGNPSASFILKESHIGAPNFVNAIFQLIGKNSNAGRGINYPSALFDEASPDYQPNLFQAFEAATTSSPATPIALNESYFQLKKIEDVPSKIRTVLLLDNSASISIADLAEIKSAAKVVVDKMFDQQEIAIYSFSGSYNLVANFTPKSTANKVALKTAIDGITRGSPTTNLYGSILAMLNLPDWKESFSKDGIETGFLVVMTDGQDTSGSATLQEVIARRDKTTDKKKIYTIGLGANIDPSVLNDLTNTLYLPAENSAALSSVFEAIQNDIIDLANSYYWLNYSSPKRQSSPLGQARKLEVKLQNNTNYSADGTLSTTFISDTFTDIAPQLVINRTADRPLGIPLLGSLNIVKDTPAKTSAFTYYPPFDVSSYTWSIENTALASLTPAGSNGNRVTITPKNLDGTTKLTVKDTISNYTKTITLVIGTGAALPSQQITFVAPANRLANSAPFALAASSSSGIPVSFSLVSGPATLGGDAKTLTLTGEGLVTVRASQAGNASFAPATPVERSFTVTKASQSISFAALPGKKTTDASFILNASTNASGRTVTFDVTGQASLGADGKTITLTGLEGDITVTATQPGDSIYAAAVPVVRVFPVTVTGPPSSTLSSLIVGGATISPSFTPDTLNYTASVSNSISSLTIIPTALNLPSMITVNGAALVSGTKSSPILINVGINTITIQVTAQNSVTKTYKFSVTRALSAVATLSKLVVNSASISPTFSKATTAYTAKVKATTKSVKIVPTTTSSVSTCKVNGTIVKSGATSGPITLKTGKNTISIVVMAQSGTTKTYKITVTRAAAAASKTDLNFMAAPTADPADVKSKWKTITSMERIAGSNYLAMTVLKPANLNEAIPTIEVSPNLLDWYSGENHTTIIIDSPLILKVYDNTPLKGGKKRYIRLK